jgi:hypothetical protein
MATAAMCEHGLYTKHQVITWSKAKRPTVIFAASVRSCTERHFCCRASLRKALEGAFLDSTLTNAICAGNVTR